MARGVNKVILLGNLGQDPELKYTSNGNAVANFSIATSERYQDGQGQWQERTEWHRVVVWGKTAENCAQYLAKGRQAYIEGKLQTRKWQDRDGNDRYTTEIVARDVQFLSGGQPGGGGQGGGYGNNQGGYGGGNYGGNRQNSNQGGYDGGSGDDFGGPPPDDDIPF